MLKTIMTSLLSVGLFACASQTTQTVAVSAPMTMPQVATPTELKIYMGSLKAKPNLKSVRFEGKRYYIEESTVFESKAVKTAFVSKTINDLPALGLRFLPKEAKQYQKHMQKMKLDAVFVVLNKTLISTVKDHLTVLQDEVLLVPMPNLSAARTLAQKIRSQ